MKIAELLPFQVYSVLYKTAHDAGLVLTAPEQQPALDLQYLFEHSGLIFRINRCGQRNQYS